jgi:ubiquinone/menaquinone biosynthesis C-methylase UbiE
MSFDLLAPHYRWMECVLAGNKLQACRTTFLEEVADRKNVLILGEGNGRFLLNCRRVLASAHVTCVDASSRMLRSAQKRLARHGLSSHEIEFIQTDALRWKPDPNSFDLIVTHFFLDCFRADQVEQLVRTVAGAATSNAEWLLADFQVPVAGWRRFRARTIHLLMYAFFRAVTGLPAKTLTCPDPFLAANGFVLRSRRLREWGLLHTDRWTKVL